MKKLIRRRNKLLKIGSKYVCGICSKLYSSRSGLKKHKCKSISDIYGDFTLNLAELNGLLASLCKKLLPIYNQFPKDTANFFKASAKVAKSTESIRLINLNTSQINSYF